MKKIIKDNFRFYAGAGFTCCLITDDYESVINIGSLYSRYTASETDIQFLLCAGTGIKYNLNPNVMLVAGFNVFIPVIEKTLNSDYAQISSSSGSYSGSYDSYTKVGKQVMQFSPHFGLCCMF